MNPLLAHLYAQRLPELALDRPVPPRVPDAAQQQATAYDRHYISRHAHDLTTLRNVPVYDRLPLREEWREVLPDGAVVRVFVINERTTVRVVHTATEQRLGGAGHRYLERGRRCDHHALVIRDASIESGLTPRPSIATIRV